MVSSTVVVSSEVISLWAIGGSVVPGPSAVVASVAAASVAVAVSVAVAAATSVSAVSKGY